MRLSRVEWRRLDFRILSVLALLCGLSILFLTSAGYEPVRGIAVAYAKKQLVWILLSALTLAVLLRFPYRILLDHAWLLYALGILSLVFVRIGGEVINNSRRWIDVGFMLLQPSEFMKVILVVTLARLIRWRDDYKELKGLVRPFAVTLLPMALILLQPDLGTALLFVPVLFIMLWVAGARAKHLLLVTLMGILVSPVLYFGFLKDYQRERIDTFLFQKDQSEAEKRAEAYHLNRSLEAVGSGGFAGRGLGQGAQHVPYNETDFIFTVVAEEWGFLGSLFVLALYGTLFLFLCDVAVSTKEPAGKLLVVGVLTLLFTQTAINVAMTVGLAPITGLTLPFLSYGGSSLLSLSLAVGLVLNVKLHPQYVFKRDM